MLMMMMHWDTKTVLKQKCEVIDRLGDNVQNEKSELAQASIVRWLPFPSIALSFWFANFQFSTLNQSSLFLALLQLGTV